MAHLSNHNHPHISLQREEALGGVSNTKVLLDLYLRLSWTRCPRGRDYVQGERLCACERVTRKVVSGNTCSSGWTKWSLKATGSHCKLLSQAGFVQTNFQKHNWPRGMVTGWGRSGSSQATCPVQFPQCYVIFVLTVIL